MSDTFTDCRSETGVTVGLIDGLIAIARVLAQRDHSAPEIKEALQDLRNDEDVAIVMKCELNSVNSQAVKATV